MSDLYLQDEPNDNERYVSRVPGALPGVAIEQLSPSAEADNNPNNKVIFNENSSIREPIESQLFYKLSEDSLDLINGQESPIGGKTAMLSYPDTDSYLSVSPSPDPDSKKKTFDFSMIDPSHDKHNLSAAIQMEQEFLDFMFSLPQIQKEAIAKEKASSVVAHLPPNSEEILEKKIIKKVPQKPDPPAPNTSRVGLDHLDNLCRMMEQLGELKEQNTRLQRRVQYLEELKTLQEMHRDMQDSIAARKSALSLGSVSLSDSDLRLEELNKSCAYLLDSQESLEQTVSMAKSKADQMLEPPEAAIALHRHSSSEDDRRVKDDPRRSSDKEKKGHKSAWGKVKHMISYNTRRENVRKKSTAGVETPRKTSPMLTKSMSLASAKNNGQGIPSAGPSLEGVGIFDPEEYETEYDLMDPDATSWDWDAEGGGGIWMGPKLPNESQGNSDPTNILQPSQTDNFLGIKKNKPQLTITVPSSENLNNALRPRNSSPAIDLKPSTSPSKQQQQQFQNHLSQTHNLQSSQPSSPAKQKNQLKSNFSFDVTGPYESDSPSGVSPEISPDDLMLPRPHRANKGRQRGGPNARHGSLPSSVVHKNLIDLQRTLTGEFNKKLQEWERLKNHQTAYSGGGGSSGLESSRGELVKGGSIQQAGEGLPNEFKKKLHEWEKIKGREKEKEKQNRSSETSRLQGVSNAIPQGQQQQSVGQDDLKTKIHDEDDLPPDFKKKLTEWEIRKALVGKGQQNVEQLQKNLGEEFNKKLAEWERMKALSQGKISSSGLSAEGTIPSGAESTSESNLLSPRENSSLGRIRLTERNSNDDGSVINLREHIPVSARLSHLAAETAGFVVPQIPLDRKGSTHKVKKSKSGKIDKISVAKSEGQKPRDKELVWLEKELNKIEREKQRLEREKEKFLEREARLEKMRHAMRQGPAEKKEIYIKTSTGEFRFEGISQTFTKKLYEWEERRGIRPESSTFVLLDPNYKAPEKEDQSDSQNQDSKRIIRSRSESSVVEMGQTGGISSLLPHQSSLSLNEMDKEEASIIQADNKSASEPTLCQDDGQDSPKCAVLVQMEELVEEEEEEEDEEHDEGQRKDSMSKRKASSVYQDPYAPAEITRLIDSSGSEENLKRPQVEIDEEDVGVVNTMNGIVVTTPVTFVTTEHEGLRRSDSQRSEESYRSLLHENMTLLGRLKEQENLCRALETQMGDIDSKMDNVADQHLKTLEKLHRQVTIMKKSESCSRMSNPGHSVEYSSDEGAEAESSQRLIEQLKARIVELELKGDKLMAEKEELECAFKLHKSHETQIAESLLLRIRELQDAGAEVNIQTVQCQTEDSLGVPEECQDMSTETKIEKKVKKDQSQSSSQKKGTSPPSTHKKKRRKRRDEYKNNDEEYETEEEEEGTDKRKGEKELKEQHQRRKRKVPPKKVQKLHNLTADLLFQAKRLEEALVSKHDLRRGSENRKEFQIPPRIPRKRSLKGRSSLRLGKEENKTRITSRPPKGPSAPRTWSSIEAIAPDDNHENTDGSNKWESRAAALTCESQDLLAMNAELSRMAKELRKEMMSVWSFRESSSPESNSSDTREETLKMKVGNDPVSGNGSMEIIGRGSEDVPNDNDPTVKQWLEEEAREVFDGIANLQPLDADKSKSLVSIETESDTEDQSPPICTEHDKAAHSGYEESFYEDSPNDNPQTAVKCEETFQSWWDVPFPKKRKCFSKTIRIETPNEAPDKVATEQTPETSESCNFNVFENSAIENLNESKDIAADVTKEEVIQAFSVPALNAPQVSEFQFWKQSSRIISEKEDIPETPDSADLETIIPGSSGTKLGDLLKANEKESNFQDDKDTINFRLSPFYHVNSIRTRASSSTSEEEKKEEKESGLYGAEGEGPESTTGTLTTIGSSTIKSDILSSSFEYEENGKVNSNLHPRKITQPHVEACNNSQNLHNRYSSFEDHYNDFQEEWLRENPSNIFPAIRKSEFTPTQLDKVEKIIKETTMAMERDNSRLAAKVKSKSLATNVQTTFADKDTGVEQTSFETEVKAGSKSSKEDCGLRTRRVSDTQVQYDRNSKKEDEFGLFGQDNFESPQKMSKPVARNKSIRRNQSETDVLWLQQEQERQKSPLKENPDIFVPTHRTVFTLSVEGIEITPERVPGFLEEKNHVDQTTESSDTFDQDFSDGTLKDEVSLSSGASSGYQNIVERKHRSTSSVPANTGIQAVDKRNKSMSSIIPYKSHSSSHITSPTVSPTFLDAFCSSYHHNSPPVESKKRVLEAANEASPTVRNMIDLYNRRITEKQELLINPFKPGDPYGEQKNKRSFPDSDTEKHLIKGKILKSQSASVLPPRPLFDNLNIQRSISGIDRTAFHKKTSLPEPAPTEKTNPLKLLNPIPSESGSNACCELDASNDENLDLYSDDSVCSQQTPEKYKGKLRASRIQKAREEFLARGAAPLKTQNRLSGEFEYYSDHSFPEDHLLCARDSSTPISETSTASAEIRSSSEAPLKPPRSAELRHLSIPHRESFRRQSESCITGDRSGKTNVLKSVSSGVIEMRNKSVQGLPPSNRENRKSSLDPSENKRNSKGIFKLFKRTKGKDKKDLATVQRLCRQSLAVEIGGSEHMFEGDGEHPSTSSSPPIVPRISDEGERNSKTLPREGPAEGSASTSRSCPSSPVGRRKSKPAQWLEMGRNIFKNRSPSPNKRQS